MLASLVEHGIGGVRVRALGIDRAGEVRLGRFLHNPRVTPAEMVATSRARTLTRVAGRDVLVIQDTTSLRETVEDSETGETTQRSLQLHPAIVLDAGTGALIGLLDALFLQRSGGKRATKAKRPFADKESRRWLDMTIRAAELEKAGATRVTMVADRESDIYEEFALRPAAVDLVIRVQQDRVLADDTLLSQCLEQAPELGRETIHLPAGPGRRARDAELSLRARSVSLKAPKRVKYEDASIPQQVELWLVEAKEVEPPAGVEPAHWLLFSTRPVPDLATAKSITATYRQRWTIEQLFRTMKTKGFDIEASRVEEGGPFENLAAATLIAAVQVLQMVRERDGQIGQKLEDAFDAADHPAMAAICKKMEGKTLRQKNPHPPDTMAWIAWICARLGGWNAYYGKPGPIVIHQGLLKLQILIQGWNLRALV